MPVTPLPDGTISTARYAARGPVPAPVTEELRLGNWLDNLLTEYELDYEAAKAAAWEEDPHVALLLAAVTAAEQAWQAARDESAACKQKLSYAKRTGTPARIAAAMAAAAQAQQAYRAAVKARQEAAAALRDIKGLRWHVAKAAINAAAEERDRKIAAKRVRDMRKQGQTDKLRYHRFDGTGTVVVQIQRELGVTPEIRAQVTALKAAGRTPGQIKAETGVRAMTAAKMKPEGAVKEGDPPCTAAALADETGKWRSSVRLTPELPAGFEELPRGERRRIASQGMFAIRTGSAANLAVSVVPVTVHRRMRGDGDVKYAKLTVTRNGPDKDMSVSLTQRVPAPQPRAGGRLVCVHAGWRALPDGSLRVAVISGAGPLTPGLAAPGGRDARAGELTGVVRDLGDGCHEVVIPARWRDQDAATAKTRSVRDLARDTAIAAAADWLAASPRYETTDGEPLPAAHEVRRWQSPGRLAVLGQRAARGDYGDDAAGLGELIAGWAVPDLEAWRREARGRRHLTRRRDDAWANVAAWLCTGTREVRVDEWDIRAVTRRPGPGETDDPQAAAARANRTLAAPGALRQRLTITAVLAGVTVTVLDPPDAGSVLQVHAGCGGVLDRDARRESIVVQCPGCGARVEQDVNMGRLMAARHPSA